MDRRQEYTKINAQTWDDWAQNGCEWSLPVSPEDCEAARRGEWGVYLTPTRLVPKEWFPPSLEGVELLGLASGGGQQMPLFSLVGANCTVVDYSDRQLASERMVARREGYDIRIVQADMTKRLPLEDESFDLIFHPVSNCYIEDVHHVWRECYRLLRHGGLLLAGMDNGLNFLFDDEEPPLTVKNRLPYNPLTASEEDYRCMVEQREGIQFSHTLEDQIAGQLHAGFCLTDLYEDRDRPGCGLLREYAPQYLATRAVKP